MFFLAVCAWPILLRHDCVIIAGQLSTTTQQPNDVTYEEVRGP